MIIRELREIMWFQAFLNCKMANLDFMKESPLTTPSLPSSAVDNNHGRTIMSPLKALSHRSGVELLGWGIVLGIVGTSRKYIVY